MGQTLQPSYEEEELTEEEIAEALAAAKRQKAANKRSEEYRKKISTPVKPVKLNYADLKAYIISRAKEEIVGYKVSEQDSIIWKKLLTYFCEDPAFEEMGEGYSLRKGLFIVGPIGCGKTTIAQMFRHNPYMSYKVIACRDIARQVAKEGVGVIEKYFGYMELPLNEFNQRTTTFCFDDMGAEKANVKNYGNEINTMAEILLSRYDFEKPNGFKTHITSNLTPQQLFNDYEARVSSRMSEMFNVIAFPGAAKDKRKELK